MKSPLDIQPPIALRFHEMRKDAERDAKEGLCPHCPRPIEGRPSRTLECKHVSQEIRFLQCSRCLVVVALPN